MSSNSNACYRQEDRCANLVRVHGYALYDELHVAQHLVVHVALQVRDLHRGNGHVSKA
jgi:hypothetical protein